MYLISKSPGYATSGVDGEKFVEGDGFMTSLVVRLRYLRNYKSCPVRRVSIKKVSGESRLLGMPTIFDRCVQQLLVLVLEPLIGPVSDLDSCDYKKSRSAPNVLGHIRRALESREDRVNKWIYTVGIESFFNNIGQK